MTELESIRQEVKCRPEIQPNDSGEGFTIYGHYLVDGKRVSLGHFKEGDLIAIIDGIPYRLSRSAFGRAAVAYHKAQTSHE